MAINRAYTYLGALQGPGMSAPYHVWEGRYTALTGDTYLRATRITLTFAGLSRVSGVLGISGGLADDGSNLGNPVVLLSISTNVVTLMMLETGAGAGVGLAEKTNAEAYGDTLDLRVAVFGL